MDIKGSAFTAFLNKRENWLIPAFCCLLLFLGIGLAWDYYFDLNDDVLISFCGPCPPCLPDCTGCFRALRCSAPFSGSARREASS